MTNKDVAKMLDCIKEHVFCEEAHRDFDYCQENDCLECQIDYCKKNLEEGYDLMF